MSPLLVTPVHQMPTSTDRGSWPFSASAMKQTAPPSETLTAPNALKRQLSSRLGTLVSLSFATQASVSVAFVQLKIPLRAFGSVIRRPLLNRPLLTSKVDMMNSHEFQSVQYWPGGLHGRGMQALPTRRWTASMLCPRPRRRYLNKPVREMLAPCVSSSVYVHSYSPGDLVGAARLSRVIVGCCAFSAWHENFS